MYGAESEERNLAKKKVEDDLTKVTVRLTKSKKEMLIRVVEKSPYNSIAELVRAGIDKELNIQIYKDNLDFIIKELDKLIDEKLNPFIKSQRKLNVKNLRTNAINTYLIGEVFSKILGDQMHNEFLKILSEARKKANYYISRETEDMTKQDLYDFYTIGEIYRNE